MVRGFFCRLPHTEATLQVIDGAWVMVFAGEGGIWIFGEMNLLLSDGFRRFFKAIFPAYPIFKKPGFVGKTLMLPDVSPCALPP